MKKIYIHDCTASVYVCYSLSPIIFVFLFFCFSYSLIFVFRYFSILYNLCVPGRYLSSSSCCSSSFSFSSCFVVSGRFYQLFSYSPVFVSLPISRRCSFCRFLSSVIVSFSFFSSSSCCSSFFFLLFLPFLQSALFLTLFVVPPSSHHVLSFCYFRSSVIVSFKPLSPPPAFLLSPSPVPPFSSVGVISHPPLSSGFHALLNWSHYVMHSSLFNCSIVWCCVLHSFIAPATPYPCYPRPTRSPSPRPPPRRLPRPTPSVVFPSLFSSFVLVVTFSVRILLVLYFFLIVAHIYPSSFLFSLFSSLLLLLLLLLLFLFFFLFRLPRF